MSPKPSEDPDCEDVDEVHHELFEAYFTLEIAAK